MYDRYKSKKRNTVPLRALGLIILLGAIGFLGFKYRSHLAFWKYSQSKVYRQLDEARRITSIERRREALADLAGTFDRYKKERPVDAEAFYLSGEVRYLLGESMLPGNFSEMVINDTARNAGTDAKTEFLRAVRDIRKGCALDRGGLNDARTFMLARASFYTGYNEPVDIFKMMDITAESSALNDVDNARFYALLCILGGREEQGLKLLAEKGMVREGIQGTLFRATAERLARRYTGAIVSYKDALSRTDDDRIRKLIHVNLGVIYFNQSLFRESLDQFTRALAIDEKDTMPRIWIGKNYRALGDRDRAKAIWSEIITTDGSNDEARELLKAM